ncbi:MAG TPA: N-formylglutamate deformylase [Steroidobacteraceae bacterium]|nr:N-formylglutamate deformylase [Steroidobacteraceae bacterium]
MTAASADPRPADEPLFLTTEGTSPLVISMPHSGTYLPAAIAARIEPAARDLPDTDWFVPQLYEFHAALGASVIRATHSRYLVDLNRPPDGARLYPGKRETAVCPTETFDGGALYAPGDEPTAAQVEERLQRYWRPFHARLRQLIDLQIARHGHCLLWDAHSIRSTVPALFDGRLPDLNVGTADGGSCAVNTARHIALHLGAQERFSYVLDGRFKGGYITRHYGAPAHGVEAVQLEIAQAAYLREARRPQFDAARAAPLVQLLHALLGSLRDRAVRGA